MRNKERRKKNIFKDKMFLIVIAVIILSLLSMIIVFAKRNNMTPEETISKFMYLVENKEYEKAKKLCSEQLEHLDLLANVKPSNLSFEFSGDKKTATSVLLEEEIEVTKLNVKLESTIMGYRIKDFNVTVEAIDPQEIEDRLDNGKNVTDIQFFHWANSNIASKEEIKKYAKDNEMVIAFFLVAMEKQNYDKANQLYQPLLDTNLTVEQLKEYNWDNYKIVSSLEILKGPDGDWDSFVVKLGEKTINISVAGKEILGIMAT